MNLPATRRRLLSGVMGAGLLVATMGPATLAQTPVAGSPVSGEAVTAEPGQDVKMMLLPKFLGILPFDQANQGAQEAAAELQNPTAVRLRRSDRREQRCRADRIRDQRAGWWLRRRHALEQLRRPDRARGRCRAGGRNQVVTWDSPIPTGEGEDALRGPGGLRRDRSGDGRDGALDPG